ncbi:MAG: SufS family cysteine desulfurase [Alistipes sp.]|nr:SufS family cysteine desulfurase [Alistipes sp.]MBR2976196.1 SufS family cysteine desulfurase [Alistipes sp.]
MALDINRIREDFPILSREVYGRPLVYLDSGATAQKPRSVVECEERIYRTINANVHRGVHHLSDMMTGEYEAARETMRRFIGAASCEEVIFTSGATMSLNMVASAWCDYALGKGDNIVVSHIEHHSNIVPWQLAAARKGAELRVIPVGDDGALMMESLDSLLDERTKVVAVTQASNTLGTRPDLGAIIDKAHAVGAVVVVDGCQGVVHGGVDVKALGCDFYAFSGHKLYGPTGTGVLYGRRELLEAMPPYMGGGDMVDKVTFEHTTYAPLPLKFEAGTPNFVGAVAMAEAVRYLDTLPSAEVEAHERGVCDYATQRLMEIEGMRIFGTTADKAPIISFRVEGCDHYDVGMILDKMGVAVRTGHHCAEPTMARFGVTGMCRASFGLYNTMADVDSLVEGVRRAVRMLK